MEAIKGWKHAGSDLMKLRSQKAALSHTAKLVSLKKDGTESGMHDATSTYPTEQDARRRHAELVKLNPTRNIRHNLYVDNKLVATLTPEHLTEVSHKVGMAADKALARSGSITPEEQQKYMQKYQELEDKENQLSAKPDAHTGKYAKEFVNIARQKVKVARAGHLNAFGQPITEHASSCATGAASVASVAQPLGAIMRRPSLFGYTPVTKKTRKRAKSGSAS